MLAQIQYLSAYLYYKQEVKLLEEYQVANPVIDIVCSLGANRMELVETMDSIAPYVKERLPCV